MNGPSPRGGGTEILVKSVLNLSIPSPSRFSCGLREMGTTEGKKKRWRAEEAIDGNHLALEALREVIIYPSLYAKEARRVGLKWPRGLLLHGPSGTGKTSLVRAVVRECNAFLTTINPVDVHSPHPGEGEKLLRDTFSQAYSHASSGKPAVIFLDEIDCICPHRSSMKEHGARIVVQLLTLLDGGNSGSVPHIAVVASTNRVDAIDSALRRPGRFDSEVAVKVPTVDERRQILELHSRPLHLDDTVDLGVVAASCHGYVGADLSALCSEAYKVAYNRFCSSSVDGSVTLSMDDWESAKHNVGPSMNRGVAKEVEQIAWDDIGGLKDLKKKIQQAVEWPIKYADACKKLGIEPIRGILLYGPPGCSKTTIAKAAANVSQASFFSLSGADLYSKHVGEGEALLRKIFHQARLTAPSIIFFDETDAITPARHDVDSSGSAAVGERLLTTLLTEMDGLEEAAGIIVFGATNRPHAMDRALLRPGRFDLVLYVPPPDTEERYEILRVCTRGMSIGDDVDLQHIADHTYLFTGADLKGLCMEAGMEALREDILSGFVCRRHFETAMQSLRPSLTESAIEESRSFKAALTKSLVVSPPEPLICNEG